MKPGDVVRHYNINQKDGLRMYSSDVRLVSMVGTVNNLWTAEILTGIHKGKILKLWLYEQDVISNTKLQVVEGEKNE